MSNDRVYCPICDSDNVAEKTTTESGVDRNGNNWICEQFAYSECLDCKQEFVTSKQAKSNEQGIVRTPR